MQNKMICVRRQAPPAQFSVAQSRRSGAAACRELFRPTSRSVPGRANRLPDNIRMIETVIRWPGLLLESSQNGTFRVPEGLMVKSAAALAAADSDTPHPAIGSGIPDLEAPGRKATDVAETTAATFVRHQATGPMPGQTIATGIG